MILDARWRKPTLDGSERNGKERKEGPDAVEEARSVPAEEGEGEGGYFLDGCGEFGCVLSRSRRTWRIAISNSSR